MVTRFGIAHADVRADLFVAGLSDTAVKVSLTSMTESKPTGMIASLEHRLGGLEQLLEDTHQAITDTHAEIARAQGQRGKPFEHRDALITARRRVTELNEQMQEQATPDQDAAAASTPDNATAPTTDHAADPAAHVDSRATLARQPAPAPIGELVDQADVVQDWIMAGEDPKQRLGHHPLIWSTDDEPAVPPAPITPDRSEQARERARREAAAREQLQTANDAAHRRIAEHRDPDNDRHLDDDADQTRETTSDDIEHEI